MLKKFTIKIYDRTGSTLLKTFDNTQVKSDVSFTNKMNGGQGELVLDLNLPFDQKDSSIDFLNQVKVYMSNDDNPRGKLIYTGYISRYTPYFSAGEEGVEVTVLGLVSLLGYAYYKTIGGSYTVTQTSVDPADMLKDILDMFAVAYPSTVTYTPTSIATIGTSLSYEFREKLWAAAIDAAFELTGNGYYWYIDESGVFNLTANSTSADHVFTIGKDVQEFTVQTDSETVSNSILLRWDGGSDVYSDATSISTYGLRESIESDQSFTTSTTGDEKGAHLLGKNKNPKIKAALTINDKYDLESIKPGQTCKIRNIKIGSNVFDENMLISAVKYSPDRVVLTLEEYTNFGNTVLSIIQEQNE